jgi:hypothetical protein
MRFFVLAQRNSYILTLNQAIRHGLLEAGCYSNINSIV